MEVMKVNFGFMNYNFMLMRQPTGGRRRPPKNSIGFRSSP